jgi:hypothetical protein
MPPGLGRSTPVGCNPQQITLPQRPHPCAISQRCPKSTTGSREGRPPVAPPEAVTARVDSLIIRMYSYADYRRRRAKPQTPHRCAQGEGFRP